MYFCLEILGESSFHKYLVQSGWSGRSYAFRYNQPTHSHVRAYRTIDDYRAERVDIHKAANVWPLLGNLLPEEQLEAHVFADSASPQPARPMEQEPAPAPKRRGRNATKED